MDQREAAEQLQTIRTLMERAALYRRALGPTLVGIGILGSVAGGLGYLWTPASQSLQVFVVFWLAIAFVALVWTGFWVRRQAMRAAEPFWTPPTRRVLSAMMPPVTVAVIATASALYGTPGSTGVLTCLWLVSYGIGLHSAGYFTLRGIRLLGWAFIAAGLTAGIGTHPSLREAHLLMALTFGLGHLAAGAWVLMVERKKDA